MWFIVDLSAGAEALACLGDAARERAKGDVEIRGYRDDCDENQMLVYAFSKNMSSAKRDMAACE
jgi:hypothetical protein